MNEARVGAEGVGVPHAVAGDIHVGHVRHADQPRRQHRQLPHVGQLVGSDQDPVVGGLDPRAAHLVGDGARDGAQRGHAVQRVHGLAVLGPQEDAAVEHVAGIERTQPAAFGADLGGGIEMDAGAAAGLAGGRRLGKAEGLEHRRRRRSGRRSGRGWSGGGRGGRRRGSRGGWRRGREGWRGRGRPGGSGGRGRRQRRGRGGDDELRPALGTEARTGLAGPMSLRANKHESGGVHEACLSGHAACSFVTCGQLIGASLNSTTSRWQQGYTEPRILAGKTCSPVVGAEPFLVIWD